MREQESEAKEELTYLATSLGLPAPPPRCQQAPLRFLEAVPCGSLGGQGWPGNSTS